MKGIKKIIEIVEIKEIKKIIEISGSMRAAKYLLAGTGAALFIGSLYYKINNEIFIPLNYLGIFEWISTYGFENPQYTWWLFLLIILMAALGVNTFFCTLDRLIKIVSRFGNVRTLKLKLFLLAPHIMHFSFLMLMLAFLILYVFGINTYNNILRSGIPSSLPGTNIEMQLKGHRFFKYDRDVNEIFKGKYLNAEFDLAFIDKNKEVIKTVGMNSPCFYKGYSMHVVKFNPQSVKGMTKTVWVNLTIRKNAGNLFFIAGVFIFIIGVFLYAASIIEKNKIRSEDKE